MFAFWLAEPGIVLGLEVTSRNTAPWSIRTNLAETGMTEKLDVAAHSVGVGLFASAQSPNVFAETPFQNPVQRVLACPARARPPLKNS